jgi:hypothetical protein
MADLFQLASPQRLPQATVVRFPPRGLALRLRPSRSYLPPPDCAELFSALEIRSLKLGARNARDIDIE